MVPCDLESWVFQLDFGCVSSPHYPNLWNVQDPLSFTVSQTRDHLLLADGAKNASSLPPPPNHLQFPQLWGCKLLKLEPSFPLQAEGKLGGVCLSLPL